MSEDITVKEAGRRGGLATKKNKGGEFFKKIGRKGGKTRARNLMENGMSEDLRMKLSEAGKKGGERTLELHGKEFFQKIGRKGGRPKGYTA